MTTRVHKLRAQLQKQNLDALLITAVPNITYLTGYSNFSEVEREAFLLILQKDSIIITDRRYSEAIRKGVPHFKLLEISSQKPFSDLLKTIIKNHNITSLGFEEESLTVAEYIKLKKEITVKLTPSKKIVEDLRLIKEELEIAAIEKSCQVGDKALKHILKKIKLGIAEKELAFELEFFVKKQGYDLSFRSIVAFGPHSSIPHHQSGNQKLTKNSIVLLDFGVKVNNYCSDMTRTVFFGKAPDKYKKMYNAVLTAQEKAFEFLNHNSSILHHKLTAKAVDNIARKYIVKQGFPSIPHSLGHGIGIEVHESPRLSPVSKDQLKPGMIFSIEPGIYIPGFGGVRIEDLVALEPKSPRFLTHAQKHLIEI